MVQVDLIRRYTLRKIKELRIFISCLPAREQEAMEALAGAEGNKTAMRIADFVLQELGHPAPKPNAKGEGPTLSAARQVMGNVRKP